MCTHLCGALLSEAVSPGHSTKMMINVFTLSRCGYGAECSAQIETIIWVTGQVEVKEEEGLLCFIKTRKLTVTVIGKEDQRV